MKKEQIIEQLETSLNEYKGLNEAIDDAAFYIAAEFDKLKDYIVAKEMEHKSKSIPYQLCPKCNGDGNLLRYNTPAMISTYSNVMCDVCNGDKIIKMYYENI